MEINNLDQTIKEIPTNNPESKPSFNNWIILIIVLTFIFASNIMTYYLVKNNFNYQKSDNSGQNSDIDKKSENKDEKIIKILPALDRFHNIYVVYDEIQESCEYAIVDISSFTYDSDYISRFIEGNEISCSKDSFGELFTGYIGWLGENGYAVESAKGRVKLINILDYQLQENDVFEYDIEKYKLVGISRSPNYYLLHDLEDDKYELVDIDKNVFLENISAEDYLGGVFYDEVNDGFVFVNSLDSDNGTSYRFDFLAADNLNLRTVLTTIPIEIVPRGCYGDYLISDTVGQIKFQTGCIDVDDRYRDSEGNLIIEL